MAKNIRTLVAAAVVPLLLSVGTASAAQDPVADIYFGDIPCALALDTVEGTINNAWLNGQFLTGNAYTNYTNLMGKLAGAGIKLKENKVGDAYLLLDAIMDKATEWSSILPPQKKKLTEAAAADINRDTLQAILCTGYQPL